MAYDMQLNDVININTKKDEYVADDVPVLDKDWIKSRFMIPDDLLDPMDVKFRFSNTAEIKFTSTSLGGNIGINPRPQFTRYADIRQHGKLAKNEVRVAPGSDIGMGRYYSEAIDDNAQLVYLEFGIPKFNNLFTFMSGAIDYQDSVVANTGRSTLGYNFGQLVGGAVMLAAFPMVSMTVMALKFAYKLFMGNTLLSYYYMEETPHLYWSSVSTIVTQMATELGLLAPMLMEKEDEKDKAKGNIRSKTVGFPVKLHQEDIEEMQKFLPNLIHPSTNYIDVFAIATRAQRLANMQNRINYDNFDSGVVNENDFRGTVVPGASVIDSIDTTLRFQNLLDGITSAGRWFGDKIDEITSDSDKPEQNKSSEKSTKQATKNPDGTLNVKVTDKDLSYAETVAQTMDSAIRDGGLYAIFYTNYTGSVSDNFSNSVSNIDVADKLKSVAKGNRNVKFNLAGGNIAGDDIKNAIGYAKDVVAGALDSVSFGLSSVISTLTGDAYIDLPKKWDDSSMSLASVTYTIQLRSPYGNFLSQLQNLYIPIAMLLAGALPRSTGKSSYTAPFLCKLFTKGVQDIKLGMITNLTITRGVGNLGFDRLRRPLGFDVTFTVTDFSTLVTAPVNGSIFDTFSTALEDDSPMGRYIGTLTSRDLLTNKYAGRKFRLRASRVLMNLHKAVSPASIGLRMGASLSGVLGGLASDHAISLSQSNK